MIRSSTRVGIGLLLVLALLNSGFLFFFPAQADTDYAWAIAPPVNAAFMGAGYLAGAVGTGLAVFVARNWRSVRGLAPGFGGLGVTMLAATLIHADKFRWEYAPTWAWTAVYAALPPLTVYLWIDQERAAGDQPPLERDSRLGAVAALWLGVGLVLLAVAILLFVTPAALLGDWPWPLTPLLARVFAGWYLLSAVTLVFTSRSVRAPRELLIPCATVACWSFLVLLLPLLYSETVDTGARLFVPFIAIHALTLGACAMAAVRSLSLERAAETPRGASASRRGSAGRTDI